MTVHQLTRADARRIAVRAQLLSAERPTDVVEVVRHLTVLQADPVNVIAPSADVVLWSRLGSSYRPDELAEALDDRTLVELHAMIRPGEDIALFRAAMARWPRAGGESDWREALYEWVEANDAMRRDILERLDFEGPLTARDLPDTAVVEWKSSGWNNNRNVRMMIDLLVSRGEVAMSGYRGRDRLWDLASRIYPDSATVPVAEATRTRDERRLRALGIARAHCTAAPNEPNDVGQAGEPAVIDGVKGEWRVDPALLGQPFRGRAALLSPIDRLVLDRTRMSELFDFDYQLEMFKPPAKRRWGYWALPILYGDRLVGKLDATADRRAGVLLVDAIHEDAPFGKTMAAAVHRELRGLAEWLELDLALPA